MITVLKELTSVSDESVLAEYDVGRRAADTGADACDDPAGHQHQEVGSEEQHGPAEGLDAGVKIVQIRVANIGW